RNAREGGLPYSSRGNGRQNASPRTRYFLSLLVSWPTTPPTAAPPIVPAVLPPVRTLPATPPTAAPIAVSFCCGVIVLQPPSINVVTIALTENICMAFIGNTSLSHIRFTGKFASVAGQSRRGVMPPIPPICRVPEASCTSLTPLGDR